MENSKHANVYSLEASAKKISDGLDALLEKKPRMYEKTKIRYKDLAINLLSSAEKISKILQDVALSSQGDDEFDELCTGGLDSQIDSALQSAQLEISAAKSFSSDSRSFVDLQQIDKVLEELKFLNSQWVEIDRCANLLYNWFHCRFISYPPPACNYTYLGSWIHAFMLAYGKACADDTTSKFANSLMFWCEQLAQQSTASKYVLPFQIYSITKSDEPLEFTIQAVLINDVIYSNCLYKLSNQYASFDSLEVCRIVKRKNPSLIPKLNTRFAKQQELLESSGFSRA